MKNALSNASEQDNKTRASQDKPRQDKPRQDTTCSKGFLAQMGCKRKIFFLFTK